MQKGKAENKKKKKKNKYEKVNARLYEAMYVITNIRVYTRIDVNLNNYYYPADVEKRGQSIDNSDRRSINCGLIGLRVCKERMKKRR